MNVALIGTGSVVREIYVHLYYNSRYTSLIDVVAICDSDAKVLNDFGNLHNIPADCRFTEYRQMFDAAERGGIPPIHMSAISTPDAMHRTPVIDSLERGIDVLLPKPLASTVADADAIIRSVENTGRFLGVDFHKRENPNIQEARARYREGTYGTLQSAVWYMMDRLLVADPNHQPRFFSSPDFAAVNSPVSFLTSHIADSFITITGLRPRRIRSTGYKQRLASLRPISVDGYDLVDTEVVFESGSVAHFIAGWALPNTAAALTIQSARLVFSHALVDIQLDSPGLTETTNSAFNRPHVLFRTFRENNVVTGFGIDSPAKIVEDIDRFRNGRMAPEERRQLITPEALGFWPTVICDCAESSLEAGSELTKGVVIGTDVEVEARLKSELGDERASRYLGGH